MRPIVDDHAYHVFQFKIASAGEDCGKDWTREGEDISRIELRCLLANRCSDKPLNTMRG